MTWHSQASLKRIQSYSMMMMMMMRRVSTTVLLYLFLIRGTLPWLWNNFASPVAQFTIKWRSNFRTSKGCSTLVENHCSMITLKTHFFILAPFPGKIIICWHPWLWFNSKWKSNFGGLQNPGWEPLFDDNTLKLKPDMRAILWK